VVARAVVCSVATDRKLDLGDRLAAAEEQVRAAGHGEIWLAVVPGNTTARRFYAAHGWVDRGAETYDALTLAGATVPVPVHRYVKAL